jgi:two-component system sensor histidine kinase/response regulator
MDETILVADDEDFIADVIAILLEDEGYRVLRAKNGAEALALAEGERPDLVLSDVMMPLLSGLELARELRNRENGYGPPIILCSAVPPPRDLPARTVFVAKPFDIEALTATVHTLLAQTAGTSPADAAPETRQ